MRPFSVVIICKNEADIIPQTLQSLQGLTDDIIVYDNGSTDGTRQKTEPFNVHFHDGSWEGFGRTKSKANRLAKYDWILSLDADEAIDQTLKQSLSDWKPGDEKTVYNIRFKNFLGKRHMRFGEWGRDHHIRFFNRNKVNWDEAPVHESLRFPEGVIVKKLKGSILHRTMKDMKDYSDKMMRYAILSAEKYHFQGKKANWFKIRISPGLVFFANYIIKLGFLDGYAGYKSARMTAWYSFLKYSRLKELNRGEANG